MTFIINPVILVIYYTHIHIGINIFMSCFFIFLSILFQLSFNDFLQRIYLDHLTKAVLNKKFTIVEFEDASIVIRYPGNGLYRQLPSWKQVKVE